MKKILIAICLNFTLIWSFNAQYTVVDYKPCESLSGISTFVDQVSPSNPMFWEVLNGYSGNGYGVIGSCYGAYIEYLQNFSGNSYLEFYCKAFQMGYSNLTPVVTIDGMALTTTLLNTNTTGSYIKLRTSNINPGNHVVRIEYGHTGMYYQYFIDEINTFSDANSSLPEISEESFNVYPTIASDFIQINFLNAVQTSYSILNSLGEVVSVGNIQNSNTLVNIESLEKGVYFVRIDNIQLSKRFIR